MRSEVIYETECLITKAAVKSSSTNIIPKGNVVIATRVGLGKVCLLGQDTAINQDLRGIVPLDPKGLSVRFLFWWLKSITDTIVAEGTGATVQGVKLPFVKSLQLPLPSPPEQQRIVAILDEAFDGIATAKANAEKNLRNARELFENHLESSFSYDGVGTWMKPLGEIATFRNGINYTQQSKGQSVRIIGVKDFQKSFWAPMEDLDSVTLDGHLSTTDAVRAGDIISVRSNGNPLLIGRCILVPEHQGSVSHSGFTIRIRLNTDSALPNYVCHFLKSQTARRELIAGGNGANIKSLNQGTLAAIRVPVPPVAKQHATVQSIETMSEEAVHLEDIYRQKLAALDELKQSLLHRAFNGDL